MNKMEISYQENYSRGELLLRTLFGALYIALPHLFVLFFLAIGAAVVNFIAFWAILFTGRYPQGMFEFMVKYQRWNWRLNASLNNLIDGYPPFGLNAEMEGITYEIDYPETLSRGTLLLKAFFGFIYVAIPHYFILIFRTIASSFLQFLAWWAVLFTGNYPKSWFDFNVGTMRWSARVGLYLGYMTDVYPPFSGKPDSEL